MFDLSIAGGIARLTLSRPKARNAVPLAGWADLARLAQEAACADARLLILAGAPGGAFCAGADISDFPAMREDVALRASFRPAMREALDVLRDLPIPSLAAIDGACFGAGVALAMACDLRFTGPAARFAITPAKFGLSYPQEDISRLVALVGEGQAARLLFGAGAIDGAEARRIGLVEVHAETGFAEAVDDFACAVLTNSAQSLGALKRGLRLAADGVRSDEEQDRVFDALLASDDLAQRLAAVRRR